MNPPDEQISRTVVRMVGRNSRLPAGVRSSSRAVVAAWRAMKCDCGHASLVPGCHATTCGYRIFWVRASVGLPPDGQPPGRP